MATRIKDTMEEKILSLKYGAVLTGYHFFYNYLKTSKNLRISSLFTSYKKNFFSVLSEDLVRTESDP